MRVIGFNFEKISAEKKNPIKGKIEIASNINIKEITQEKLDVVKDKPVLKLTFDFTVQYKPNIAEIKLEGLILVLAEKDESKAILKKWKNKKISDDIRVPIFNHILTKSNLRALQLEEELNLPAHIPMPKIRQEGQDSNQNKTGYAG